MEEITIDRHKNENSDVKDVIKVSSTSGIYSLGEISHSNSRLAENLVNPKNNGCLFHNQTISMMD